jgi:threonine synthase
MPKGVEKMVKFICPACGTIENSDTRKPKCDCGGLWSLDFKAPTFDLSLIDKDEWSMFRYRAFLPPLLGKDGETWKSTTLGEGMTPIVRFDEDLLLKMDYFMPTLSFKDRGAAVLISHCKAIGVERLVQDSSGNAGNSVAAYSAKAGIECEIFVPEGTSSKKISMIRSHNATVHVVQGSRDHCADVCRSKVAAEGLYYASHVYNPYFFEGTKTYIYEIFEQLGRIPHNLFVPLGNGTLFLGVVQGLKELLCSGAIKSMPHIIAVQSERCDPIARAVAEGSYTPISVIPEPTLAEGIAIGQPMRGVEILRAIRDFGIDIILAPENRILEARRALAARGIHCEHTTAATYAAYIAHSESSGRVTDSLIPMCGAGLKSES